MIFFFLHKYVANTLFLVSRDVIRYQLYVPLIYILTVRNPITSVQAHFDQNYSEFTVLGPYFAFWCLTGYQKMFDSGCLVRYVCARFYNFWFRSYEVDLGRGRKKC